MSNRLMIVYPWHDSNKGDAAILLGILSALKYHDPSQDFDIASCIAASSPLNKGILRHTRALFREVRELPPPLPAFSEQLIGERLPLTLRALAKLAFPTIIPSKPSERAIETSRAVIMTGGLYLAFPHTAFYRLPFRLFAYAYPALYAARNKKRFILYGHSLGPYRNRASRAFMKYLLARAELIVVRESHSASLLQDMHIPTEKILVRPDPAFALPISSPDAILQVMQHHKLATQGFVAISARSLESYGHSKSRFEQYIRMLDHLITKLTNRGYKVALVSHTQGPTRHEDDRLISRLVYDRLSPNVQTATVIVDEDLSPSQLAAFYRQAALTVATRFHAAVLSVLAGTPTLAIPYFGTKTQGAFHDLGIADYVLELDRIQDTMLADRALNILNESTSERERFKEVARNVYQASLESARLILKHLDTSTP